MISEMQNYKQYHEKYMQNHNGTTSWETFSLIFPSFFQVFIATTTTSFILNNILVESKFTSVLVQYMVEFLCIIIPIVITITILESYTIYVLVTLLVISIFSFLLYSQVKYKSSSKECVIGTKRHFITNARSTITIITIVAILAVDFQIFPRRFAKTETFGYSLMDVGVGLFVFTNGIVAYEINKRPQPLLKSVMSTIPLWALGSARFFITKEIDYQMHISEYGVHWNFFITLAVTKILCSCILSLISADHSLVISIIVLTLHEILLQSGLSTWVLSDIPRDTFVTANREGIVASLGYVGLYFMSVHIGQTVAKTKNNRESDDELCVSLSCTAVILLCSVFMLEPYFGVSRRLANAAYCLWIMFIGVFMSFLFLCGELISKHLYGVTNQTHRVYVPFIYEAVNYNGLACFLLANVLTGLVNISIQTLTIGPLFSVVIILVYMFVTCVVISILYVKNIKLKLW